MKRLLGSLALAAMIVAVAPSAALAEEGVPIKGTFTVAATVTPNTGNVTYCGGKPLNLAVEAHGTGYSTLGALSLSLQKTIASSGPAMHGCLILTAPNGDTLSAIYDGTEGAANANNFITGTGTLTFSGGTGRFWGASGSADFTAVFSLIYPQISFAGGGSGPLQVMAFYSVEGNVSLHGDQ